MIIKNELKEQILKQQPNFDWLKETTLLFLVNGQKIRGVDVQAYDEDSTLGLITKNVNDGLKYVNDSTKHKPFSAENMATKIECDDSRQTISLTFM